MNNFSVFKMFEKVIKRLIQLGLAFLANFGLAEYGIIIDPAVATLSIFGGLEALRNLLKVKFNIKWL